MLAITHVPSPRMQSCLRTYVAPGKINYQLAVQQHLQYREALLECGADVLVLDANCELPDCVFVEDTAIVLDEIAVVASMGSPTRRPETAAVERVLEQYREVHRVELPATIEGGDVLRAGRTLLVGLTSRTNPGGIEQLVDLVHPLGYRVVPVAVDGCLHLKTACTALDDDRLLVNPAWIGQMSIDGFELVEVPSVEPWGANLAKVGANLCLSSAHVQTAEMLHNLGFHVRPIELSEFEKAEGGTTCLSLIFSVVCSV